VLDCLRALDATGSDGIRIDKIIYGGEHLYEADKKEIREKFGTTLIAAHGYGTVDSWYLGYQCVQCPTGVFHAHDDQVYLEIVDEETGRHADAGEVGMLYATAYPRRLTPIVRYRVGDRAKWEAKACPCGRTTPLFHLLGRGDDVLRIGYDSVDYQAMQDAVLQVKGLTGTLQMEKRRHGGRDELILRIETSLTDDAQAAARVDLEREILEKRPAFRDFIHKKTIWPLQIEFLPPGGLPRNPRTGKLIRVIDAVREG
jgi:phenylacetate-coenzyme A ligase PaaK-like adenylate-forming protein